MMMSTVSRTGSWSRKSRRGRERLHPVVVARAMTAVRAKQAIVRNYRAACDRRSSERRRRAYDRRSVHASSTRSSAGRAVRRGDGRGRFQRPRHDASEVPRGLSAAPTAATRRRTYRTDAEDIDIGGVARGTRSPRVNDGTLATPGISARCSETAAASRARCSCCARIRS